MKTTNSRTSLLQSVDYQEEVPGVHPCSGEMVGPGRPRGRVRGNQPSRGAGRGRVTRNVTPNSASTVVSDDTLCGICSLVVGDDGIGCDRCPHWFHPSTQCTGLKDQSIQCILSDGGAGICYVCTACRCQTQGDGVSSGVPVDPGSISQLFEVVKALTQTVADLTK